MKGVIPSNPGADQEGIRRQRIKTYTRTYRPMRASRRRAFPPWPPGSDQRRLGLGNASRGYSVSATGACRLPMWLGAPSREGHRQRHSSSSRGIVSQEPGRDQHLSNRRGVHRDVSDPRARRVMVITTSRGQRRITIHTSAASGGAVPGRQDVLPCASTRRRHPDHSSRSDLASGPTRRYSRSRRWWESGQCDAIGRSCRRRRSSTRSLLLRPVGFTDFYTRSVQPTDGGAVPERRINPGIGRAPDQGVPRPRGQPIRSRAAL